MSRNNTGLAPRKRITWADAIDALTAMHVAGTDKHSAAAWNGIADSLEQAAESTRSVMRREDLLNYARDCRGLAKRAELAAKPAGIFGVRGFVSSMPDVREMPDSAAWSRAEAEIDAEDNADADTTGDDNFSWGHNP